MATILIDFEHIGVNNLNGIEYLNEKDRLEFFCGGHTNLCRRREVDLIKKSNCDVTVIRIPEPDKKDFDYYITSHIGYIVGKGCTDNILIVSNSKELKATTSYWKQMNHSGCIVLATTIEQGLKSLVTGADKERARYLGSFYKQVSIMDLMREIELEKSAKAEAFTSGTGTPDDTPTLAEDTATPSAASSLAGNSQLSPSKRYEIFYRILSDAGYSDYVSTIADLTGYPLRKETVPYSAFQKLRTKFDLTESEEICKLLKEVERQLIGR